MALRILALLQSICLMSSRRLLLVWLIFFMVGIKRLPILGTISGKTVKFFFLIMRRPRNSPLFPYPPLFRSAVDALGGALATVLVERRGDDLADGRAVEPLVHDPELLGDPRFKHDTAGGGLDDPAVVRDL